MNGPVLASVKSSAKQFEVTIPCDSSIEMIMSSCWFKVTFTMRLHRSEGLEQPGLFFVELISLKLVGQILCVGMNCRCFFEFFLISLQTFLKFSFCFVITGYRVEIYAET